MKNKDLKIEGTLLSKEQLKEYLKKVANSHSLINKSDKKTYPIPKMLENYRCIEKVYNLLNEHVKLGINIHPAGEWLLDNFYIIEENVKNIKKELNIKKYKDFVGISNGKYKGFARIFIIASTIVAFSDNKIDKKSLEEYLRSYQEKKTLSMEEIWNIGLFLQIAIIENIKDICRKIYLVQMQKYKAENIVERLIENKDNNNQKYKNYKIINIIKDNRRDFKTNDIPTAFIEYMSYILKRYGKKGYPYLKSLEEILDMKGTSLSEIIKREHFDIALKKVSMGNSIISLKKIQRINFLDIFEKINGVDEILKKDPCNVYEKMDNKTKEMYRNKIKEISNKTKLSEIYISKKILELANRNKLDKRQTHIGYYLIDDGRDELYNLLQITKNFRMKNENKVKLYIVMIVFFSITLSLGLINSIGIKNIWINLIGFVLFLIPSSEICIQTIQYVLSRIIKPKTIPKLDFSKGIDKENSSMVVIPTILSSKSKVEELVKKLEVFYLANKSENIYFTLLGDCTESQKKEEKFDKEIIDTGIKEIEKLNERYSKSEKIKIFNFIYRKRIWNEKEESYLGWERKRGLLTEFNEYLLGNKNNTFIENTFEKNKIPKIKYIITLDSDTDLILNSAFELIGAMAHILNEPIIENGIVTKGYGIMQPRVGINLTTSYKSLFTKIFAGAGGIDSYTNAISDIYQDNFFEGIFTGKGIYNLEVYSKVLKNKIPDNMVLSHDLLEGCYLRCGLVSDIMLMDGYPLKYNSFTNRLSRWIRGDWQIIRWLKKESKLNLLSRFKIFDNLRRSLFEISIVMLFVFLNVISIKKNNNVFFSNILLLIISVFPYFLELFNHVLFKKEGEEKQKTFTPKVSGIKGIIYRMIISFICIPYKAYFSIKAILKTLYRLFFSHKYLLEWTTSEDAEKQAKSDIKSYYMQMGFNIIFSIIVFLISFFSKQAYLYFFAILWEIAPLFMWYISIEEKESYSLKKIGDEEKNYIMEVGKRTWEFFNDFLDEKNNYLIPDNYQEERKEKVVKRTSSTNIGLSLVAIMSAYDLKFIDFNKTFFLLEKVINTICELQKWNGHLYNWYNIETKDPLLPRYISTVDSGNFVGYLYVVKSFLKENLNKNGNLKNLINIVDKLINDTDFPLLYSNEQQIFSIGFNIEENKLTDSYYDLLASEARQASFIAIAKKDIPSKHWSNLGRTLTKLKKYKGLISWSGTAFEYLMPNINIPRFKGSLLDESCKFMINCQMEYSKKLNIPWGISEAAFNLKDLKSNYQYKAFGIPWLGLKRGLGDEIVVSPYASILAITDYPKEEVDNLKSLEKLGMLSKYGFYESIDFTPERQEKGKKSSVVKTYMAHHQSLILLSINNLFNNNIIQKRFISNPEMKATEILLQENMPETYITTKEKKEKVKKFEYKDFEDYVQNDYSKLDYRLIRANVISNENYTIAMNQKGEGFSKYKNIYINRFKNTDDYSQGIFFCIKNIRNNNILSSNYNLNNESQSKYQISFMPDKNVQEIINGNIKTKVITTVASNESIELRRIIINNQGNEDEILEVVGYLEPILSKKEQDYAHPCFNSLFLTTKFDEETNSLIVKRKNRDKNEEKAVVAINLSTKCETVGDIEFEIDKEKFIGRGNLKIPNMIKNSNTFSKKIGIVTDPIIAIKRMIKAKPNEEFVLDLVLSVDEDEKKAINKLKEYLIEEKVKKEIDINKARIEAENRYLRVKGKDIETYQKILSLIIFKNNLRSEQVKKLNLNRDYSKEELWKYGISGDLPIILIKIRDANDSYVIKEVLKMHEFFNSKNIQTEVVIIDEEKHSYENYVKEEIETTILNYHMSHLKNINGGIFILTKSEISLKDLELLEFVSTFVIDTKKGGINNNFKELEECYLENNKEFSNEDKVEIIEYEDVKDKNILSENNNLKYYNEYGGFSEDGKEYLIKINKNNRLPSVWCNILSNDSFGTLLTDSMGGYTWFKNSRLNKVTAWTNYVEYDIPSEVIYLKDTENKKTWSLGLNTKPDDNNYNIIHGFGYSKYIHFSNGIEQEIEFFVPKEDSCKIGILKLKNNNSMRKKLSIYYYLKPVIGEDEVKTNGNILLKYNKNSNMIIARNLYGGNNYIYISSSESIKSYTGDKEFFLGNNKIDNPEGLKKNSLNNDNSIGKNTCICIEIEIELDSFETKEISFILGASKDILDCKNIAYKYQKNSNCKEELRIIKNFWEDLFSTVKVYTPIDSINIMLNGWTKYQVISSRLYGRTGFYQSGGAFGFRDQLQDTLGLKYINPDFLKNQIVKHSRHQFLEGDVLHWWHDDNSRGIRTRFSDDLLWLCYSVIEYIEFTGDYSILDIKTPYLEGEILKDSEDERYEKYEAGKIEEDIYNHCIRAIEKSLEFGENGLPKIGSGDWNDGFNTVGNKGKGESVWLGFFLFFILDKFIPICEEKGDLDLKNKYEKVKNELKRSLNTKGWDGRWFRRAFTDDGDILGSIENDECRIDSISQSWSVISNAGDNDKKFISMESLENHLIDKENGIIKLLDPPFEKGKFDPGYIKAYLPGTRENGGQYTHAAIWVIMAYAILGFGDKALELYRMINPIEHTRTKDAVKKYKTEPYSIPADVYSQEGLKGRGGWTWYTGSASWYYKVGIEYILGLRIEKGYMKILPCIPKDWKEYEIKYKWKESKYNIKIKNLYGKNTWKNNESKIFLDGKEIENNLKLDGSNCEYNVIVEL